MGAFPNLSPNVPFCPHLSSFVPIFPRSGPQEGQKRTNGDKTGHFGTNWETPSFSIYPHLALLNSSSSSLCHFIASCPQDALEATPPNQGTHQAVCFPGVWRDIPNFSTPTTQISLCPLGLPELKVGCSNSQSQSASDLKSQSPNRRTFRPNRCLGQLDAILCV